MCSSRASRVHWGPHKPSTANPGCLVCVLGGSGFGVHFQTHSLSVLPLFGLQRVAPTSPTAPPPPPCRKKATNKRAHKEWSPEDIGDIIPFQPLCSMLNHTPNPGSHYQQSPHIYWPGSHMLPGYGCTKGCMCETQVCLVLNPSFNKDSLHSQPLTTSRCSGPNKNLRFGTWPGLYPNPPGTYYIGL